MDSGSLELERLFVHLNNMIAINIWKTLNQCNQVFRWYFINQLKTKIIIILSDLIYTIINISIFVVTMYYIMYIHNIYEYIFKQNKSKVMFIKISFQCEA